MTEKPPAPEPDVSDLTDELNYVGALLVVLAAGVIVVLTAVAVLWK